MATALTALKKQVQIGNESTPGTAVPATDILLAILEAPVTSAEFFVPEDDRNLLAIDKANRFKVSDTSEITITGSVNSRLAPFLFGNAIRGNITPTQPDVTNEPLAYLWSYAHNLTVANTPDVAAGIDTYTVEYGDNVDDYEARYAFTKTLVISGTAGEPVTFEQTITVADITAGITPTAGLTITTPQYFPANTASFYIDANYAGIGGTVKADTLKSFTWTLETMFTPRFTSSGVFILSGVNEAAKQVELEMEFLRGTTSEAEKVKAIAGTTTYLRIKLLAGTEIDSAQSNPPYIHLDGAYQYELPWDSPEDADGARTHTVTAKSVYDATGTRDFEVAVFTDLAAWPA